jgi:hypothetical protein
LGTTDDVAATALRITMRAYDAVMRTTVSIDDRLLTQAKVVAAGNGRTLSDLVEDGLRLLLAQGSRPTSANVVLPVFGGSGLLPGVDLEDKDGLTARLEEPDDARAAG